MPQNVDKFSIGGKSAETITARYVIGYSREGFANAHCEGADNDAHPVERIIHTADVTMPKLYVGSAQERDTWRRDEILAHYGMEA
jgi:hypothetical protein